MSKYLKKFEKFGVVTLLLGAALVYLVVPTAQPHLFPIVSDTKIVKIEASKTPGKTLIWLTFTKNYDCEYLSLSWFHGKRDTEFNKVSTYFLEDYVHDHSDQSRPVGKNVAGPWEIDVPMREFENTFGDVSHDCKLIGKTRTKFFN